MGTSSGQGVIQSPNKMRSFAFVLLTAAALADSEPKADADAYTIGQVAYGLAPGVITGVDYGAIGNRGYLGYGGAYGGYGGAYGGAYGGYYGKREADSDAYTIGQVAHGHAYGVITGVDYGHGLVSGYGAIGNRGYHGHVGYGGYGGYGYYGKREADSDSEAYTIGQIAYGLPQANAYATGHPHNVGVITGVDYGHGHVSGYGAVGNRGYSGYGGAYGGYGGYGGAYG